MIDFENTAIAFRDKNNKTVRKAYWLFRLIGSPVLVKAGSALLRFALWLGLPVNWVLKPTVFSHFCGGETIEACEKRIQLLGQSNVLTILDYSAEGKETEADFEYTKQQILATIDKSAVSKQVPYAVFKPTGLSRFALLERMQSGAMLSDDETQEFERVKARFDEICAYAVSKNVPVMVDSEESWIQDIADHLVEELMFRYNKEQPMVFNTLQMYRHDRLAYLHNFAVKAGEQGVFVAFKLVRGAYMEKERERAVKKGYPSPIYPDKEATDKAFDEATAFLLDNIRESAVCIGTHNETSCSKAAERMKSLSIKPDHSHVSFAQLLGMSDHISYNLAAAGYNVCKYVPYGPVKTVVPYLIRRAEENTSVAGQTSRELFLIKKEMQRRKSSIIIH
ncbi:MAG: proline dehydrogenase [Bacteroidia bacterium]|nr:MAG: proline dehydrogenase [Bacteroidia bacterium]